MFVNALLRAYFFFLLFFFSFFLPVLLFSSTRTFWFFMKRSTQRVPCESSNGSRWSLKLSQWLTTSYLKKTTFLYLHGGSIRISKESHRQVLYFVRFVPFRLQRPREGSEYTLSGCIARGNVQKLASTGEK